MTITPEYVYEVYGARLASTWALPELPSAPADGARVQWAFRTVADLPPMQDAALLGEEPLYAAVHARLWRHAQGHRITVDDTGTFDLSADGREVRWEERAEAWPDFVRAHLVGRVLATALFLDGLLPLHGSAVLTAEGVIGFLAPKGFGKSSLAYALVAAGARLVTDDTLPVSPEVPARAWPGVHTLRLRDDALAAATGGTPLLATPDGKRIVGDFDVAQRSHDAAPLAALYLLEPAAPEAPAATRVLAPPMPAAVGILAHVKIGRMLGAGAAPAMMPRAAAIARTVPVYRLDTPRALVRLPEVAATLLAWHGGAPR